MPTATDSICRFYLRKIGLGFSDTNAMVASACSASARCIPLVCRKRQRARLARQQLQDGVDPLDAKAAAKAARAIEQAKTITFEAAAREYFAQTEQKWRNVKHSAQFLSSLESHVFDEIGNLPVAAIDSVQVLKVLEQHHNRYPGKRL